MAKPMKSIDITNKPELRDLAETVRTAGEPYLLRCDDEAVVMVTPITTATHAAREPVKRRLKPTKRSEADRAAFFAAAGSWADVDTDTLIATLYADRRNSKRPPPKL